MANYFVNSTGKEITVSTPTGGTATIPNGKYVEGDYFAIYSQLTAVADSAAPAAADVVFAASSAIGSSNFQLDSVAVAASATSFSMLTGNAFVVWTPAADSTLTLPAAGNVLDGTIVFVTNLSSSKAVTVSAGTGTTLDSRVSAGVVASTVTALFVLSNTVWFRAV